MKISAATMVFAMLAACSATSVAQPSEPPAPEAPASSAPAPVAPPEVPAAEPPAPLTAKQKATILLKEGLAHLGDANYLAALKSFRAAHALYPSPKLLVNIGSSLRYLGKNAEAATVYQRYVRHPEASLTRKDELRRIIAEIDLVTGTLTIEVREATARLQVDARPVAVSEGRATLRVDPGPHTIVAEQPGRPAAVKTVEVAAQQELTVELRIAHTARAPPELVIITKEASAQPIVGFAVAGGGLAAVALGVAFGALASSADTDAASHCHMGLPNACDDVGASLSKTAKTRATVSTVAFIAGGSLIAAGAVIYFTAPSMPGSDTSIALLGPEPRIQLRMAW